MAIDHPKKPLAASKRKGEIHEFEHVDTGYLRGSFAGSFRGTSWQFACLVTTGRRPAKTCASATARHTAPTHGPATIAASRSAAEPSAANVYRGGIQRSEY